MYGIGCPTENHIFDDMLYVVINLNAFYLHLAYQFCLDVLLYLFE